MRSVGCPRMTDHSRYMRSNGCRSRRCRQPVQVGVRGELGRVHGVEVVEYGAIVDARTGAADGIWAVTVGCLPDHFGPEAEVVKEDIAAKAGKDAAFERREVSPLHLACGANVVLMPNAMSSLWACAKFENAAKAAQAKVKRMAIRNVCFKRNLRRSFICF